MGRKHQISEGKDSLKSRRRANGRTAGEFGIPLKIDQENEEFQEAELYRAIVENQGEGIGIVDLEERFIYANPAAEGILGVASGGLVGRNLAEFTDSDNFDEIKEQSKKRLAGEKSVYEIEIIRPDRARRVIRVTATPRYNHHRQFAGTFGIFIDITERKRAEEALALHDRGMAALYETSLAINAQLDLPALLQAIVEHAAGLLGAYMGGLYLLNPDGTKLELAVNYNLPGNLIGTTLLVGEGLSGKIAQTGESLMVADYRLWEGRADVYADSPFRRVLGVPIKIKGKVIGVINITDVEKVGLFEAHEVRLVSLLADQAAIAIENARIFDEAKQRAWLLSLVNEFSSAINQPLELKGILQAAVDDLTRVLNVAQTGLALFDKQRQHLTVVAENSAPGSHPSVGTELPIAHNLSMERILATKKYLYVEDAQHDPLLENIREIMILRQVFSILIVPLVVREEVIGTIGFDAIGAKRIFTKEEIGLAETIANLMAVRIEQARLLEELQHQAIVDELTRIYNYRGLLEHGTREIERARRFKRPLSAFFFDIDNFKDFNNRYSHMVGNLVLQAVSQCCCTITRTVDLVARYGGDEFVILLPEANLASACQVAERLRKAVEATRVTTEWGELGVTISLGVAEYEPKMVDLVALMDRANRAEHQAKELGRNRVEIAIQVAL